jgi:RNA polymerase sigma-70 factor (ECF subfamily)
VKGLPDVDRLTTKEVQEAGRASDASLLDRVAAGDRGAMSELYDRHVDVVFSLACRIVGQRTDAEDVVQEVFTQAWRQAVRYDPTRASAAAWLLNMTRSRAIDQLRAARVRRPVSGDDERLGLVPTPEKDQEAGAIGAERAQRVRAALENLGEAERQAIDLAYFSGLTHGEIAERLKEPLGTIKTRIRSGLLKLRGALVERS